MNSPVHQKLQKTLDIVQKGFEELVQHVPQQIHQQCMTANQKNIDRYAECMHKKSKNVDKQMKAFDFKMIFMGMTFDQCIQKGDQDKCILDAKTTVEGYIKEFSKKLE